MLHLNVDLFWPLTPGAPSESCNPVRLEHVAGRIPSLRPLIHGLNRALEETINLPVGGLIAEHHGQLIQDHPSNTPPSAHT